MSIKNEQTALSSGTGVGEKLLTALFYLAVLAFALFCLIPFLMVVMASVTDEKTLMAEGYRLLPSKYSLLAYKMIFSGNNSIINAYGITIFNTVVGTLLSLVMTSMLAYPLSVKTLKYRNKVNFLIYFTMLFNCGLVPMYILNTKYLHLSNKIWIYLLPVMINTFNMFMMRNFFSTIPESMAESAKIDGANDIYILFKIILPLALPSMATIGLFYAMSYWNDWFTSLLYIDNQKLYTLQYIIMKIMRSEDFMNSTIFAQYNRGIGQIVRPSRAIKLATTIVTIGPIIFLYPFLQRYFIKGILVGAVKG